MRPVREEWKEARLIGAFFFNDTATTEIYTLSLHDALPILPTWRNPYGITTGPDGNLWLAEYTRSEEHMSRLPPPLTPPPPPPLFYTLAPCRVIDTRNPAGPYGGPALLSEATRVFSMAGQCG